jgi:hypothetical protein
MPVRLADVQHRTGPIVGAVIGTILGCILLLVMLVWFRRRQRRRNNVGFFYLTPGPGQRDAELSDLPRMSQPTDLRARASESPFPSVLSLPSLLDINRSRTPTTDRRSSDLGSLPYEFLPRASSNDHLGLYRNNSSIDYPHSENPFADPSFNENTIDTAEMTVPVAPSNPVSSFVLSIVCLGSLIVFPPSLLISLVYTSPWRLNCHL